MLFLAGCLMLACSSSPQIGRGESLHDLSSVGFGVGGAILPGSCINVFGGLSTSNVSDSALTSRSVEVTDIDANIEVVGFVVADTSLNDGIAGVYRTTFPPSDLTTEPIDGYVLRPDERIGILVGLRSTDKRAGELRRVRIFYEQPAGAMKHQSLAYRAQLNEEPRADEVPCQTGTEPKR